MKLILLGAPGAGKGTQSEIIAGRLSVPIISTGNILKEAVREGTELGLKAKAFMDEGALVPDDVIIGIINKRLSGEDCADGFILDGFPRTIEQAKALEDMGVDIDKVIDIDVPDSVIIGRMSGRRTCPKCGASYHVLHRKPKTEGVCDKCNEPLIIRSDDEEATVKHRLQVYHDVTEKLKDFYQKRGKLREVAGADDIADTTRAVFAALEV